MEIENKDYHKIEQVASDYPFRLWEYKNGKKFGYRAFSTLKNLERYAFKNKLTIRIKIGNLETA